MGHTEAHTEQVDGVLPAWVVVLARVWSLGYLNLVGKGLRFEPT